MQYKWSIDFFALVLIKMQIHYCSLGAAFVALKAH